MEIKTIKERLSLSEVLVHYNLQPKNNMLKCFLHEDKTASLQVNLEKNFYKCHSCGKTGDQIQFIEDFEKLSKHEAIKKAETLLGGSPVLPVNGNIKTKVQNLELSQTQFLGNIFQYFRNAINNPRCAKSPDFEPQ